MDDIGQPRQPVLAAHDHETEPIKQPVEQDANTARLVEAAAALQRDLDAARAEHRQAVARYREVVLTSSPELPPELVSGDSIAAIDASIEAAREVVARVRDRLTAAATPPAPAGIPAGSPPRRQPDLADLSAAEKIRYGLGSRDGDGERRQR